VVSDVQLWVMLIRAAGLIYWLMDWTSEILARLFRVRPAAAATQSP